MSDFFSYLALPAALFGITAIAAMGLQLILGGAGLLTLGHTAFFAIGGYGSAAFVMYLAPQLGIVNPLMQLGLGMLFGMTVTALAAICVAGPCLRLRGDYLAAATLGFGQIVENVCNNLSDFGGASGFTGITHLASLPIIWVSVACVSLFLWRFYTTGLGQAVVCARDDEIVARAFGISPARTKLAAFVIGSTITGLAGALSAHTFEFISPPAAGFAKSVEILLAVVIGGMFSISGSILGAGLLVFIPEALRFLPEPMTRLLGWFEGHGILGAPLARFILGFTQNSLLLFALVVLVVLKRNTAGVGAWLAERWHKRAATA